MPKMKYETEMTEILNLKKKFCRVFDFLNNFRMYFFIIKCAYHPLVCMMHLHFSDLTPCIV